MKEPMVETEIDRVPLEECTPPGAIQITPAAMKLLESFQAAVPSGWIAAYSWYDGGRTRASKDAPWIDTGPGIDLGAYRSAQIPDDVVWHSGSLRFAVLIREAVLSAYPRRTLVINENGNPTLA